MRRVTGFANGPTSSGLLQWYAAVLDCGHNFYQKDPWKPLEGIGIGDEVECERCAQNSQQEDWLRNLDATIVHHARFRPRFGGQYTFYKLDATSPSGFFAIGGTYATPEIDRIIAEKKIATVSPTEHA